ncbi:unnamed protein product [Amaranthus hypochondriacus]
MNQNTSIEDHKNFLRDYLRFYKNHGDEIFAQPSYQALVLLESLPKTEFWDEVIKYFYDKIDDNFRKLNWEKTTDWWKNIPWSYTFDTMAEELIMFSRMNHDESEDNYSFQGEEESVNGPEWVSKTLPPSPYYTPAGPVLPKSLEVEDRASWTSSTPREPARLGYKTHGYGGWLYY